MSTVAIIAAKGNSRRIARKNMIDIGGRPLFAWSVIQAKHSHLVDRVYVTTDDQEIAGEASRLGARVIWRPVLHWDVSGRFVIGQAIDMALSDGDFDVIVSLLPTNPLRMPYDIDMMIRMYHAKQGPRRVINSLIMQHEVMLVKLEEDDSGMLVLGDKGARYGILAGGTAICSRQRYQEEASGPIFDSETDAGIVDHAGKPQPEVFNYLMEWWQQFEVDLLEHIPIVDFCMRRYVLTMPDIYERYGSQDMIGNHNKETRRDDGNDNQD